MTEKYRANSKPIFVLIHSPLVGPYTWSPVAEQLRHQGYQVVTPSLVDRGTQHGPYWRQHVMSGAIDLLSLPEDAILVLVGHSGAGPLLPAIGVASSRKIGGYIFVDAALPHPGQSRLEEIGESGLDFAKKLREYLIGGERFPNWTDEALKEILPDESVRGRMLAELQPRGLDFFEEALPVISGWPDAPCSYLQFSPAYDVAGAQAQRQGWNYRMLKGGHFHMLVDPAAVVEALLEFIA